MPASRKSVTNHPTLEIRCVLFLLLLVGSERGGSGYFCSGLYTLQSGNPFWRSWESIIRDRTSTGGNMESKEVRFGDVSLQYGLRHDSASMVSVTPLLYFLRRWGVWCSNVAMGWGGGLWRWDPVLRLLAFVIVAVYDRRMMVGRTTGISGQEIESYEMKMASIMILIPADPCGPGNGDCGGGSRRKSQYFQSGYHGFSEVLYAFSSASNNNGSAFAGLGANNIFYNTILGSRMFLHVTGWPFPSLRSPASCQEENCSVEFGNLPTHTPLFIFFLWYRDPCRALTFSRRWRSDRSLNI